MLSKEFVSDKPVPGDMYIRHPIRMSLVGTYHQINKFFKSIGELQRIVTITDVQFGPIEQRAATANGPMKADFIAATFQLAEPSARAQRNRTQAGGAAGGAPKKAGGGENPRKEMGGEK